MLSLLVLPSEDALGALPWARRIAAAAGESLGVLCVAKDTAGRLQEVGDVDDETPPLVRAALEAAAAADPEPVTVYDCRGPSVYRAALDAARELGAHQLVVSAPVAAGESADGVSRRLIRAAPYDVLMLDTGGVIGDPVRTLVVQLDGGGARAIAYAVRHFGAEGHPIRVIPDPGAEGRSRRVFEKAMEKLGRGSKAEISQLDADAGIDEALGREIALGDLVLLDAEEIRRLPKIVAQLKAVRTESEEVPFAVAVLRPEDAAGPGYLERALGRMRRHAPALNRVERRDLNQFLEQGGGLSTDFVVMLALSSGIAALGLIQSSPSVVIGAMLVAPLMTPLVAMGMAVTQGNLRLFRNALRAMAVGILGGLLVAMGVGLLSPWQDLSAEIVARGSPNVFDLAIALLSGMAASFALARPGLTGTLVGVAISVALLPPLAAAGIATVKREFAVALGAAVLFSTNLLAIVVGSSLVFRFFGLHVSLRSVGAPKWVRATLVFAAAGLLATTAFLAQNLRIQAGEGVHRPYSRPLPHELREAIRARVAREPGVQILFMAQSDIEHGFGLEVALCSEDEIDPALTAELRSLIEGYARTGRPIRILTLRGTLAD